MVLYVAVRGQVQGVGFRWFARECARRLDLAGWVRNLDDGSLEVAASGPDQAVDQFLSALKTGPAGARVDAVIHLPVSEAGALEKPFAVLR